MSLHYLIDGYNLLYALTPIPTGSWEQKRTAVVRKISSEKPHGKNRLTIIFDSREGLGDRHKQEGLDIIYTAGETADDWIIKKVREIPNPRAVIVVTNDQGLRRMVRGTGVKWLSTADFWKPSAEPTRKSAPLLDSDRVQDINEELRKKWLEEPPNDV